MFEKNRLRTNKCKLFPSEGTHLESTEKVLMLENAASTHEY